MHILYRVNEDRYRKQMMDMIRQGTPGTWYNLFHQYKMLQTSWKKRILFKALASTSHQFLIEELVISTTITAFRKP